MHLSKPITPLHVLKVRDYDIRLRIKKMINGVGYSAGYADYVPYALLPDGIFGEDFSRGMSFSAAGKEVSKYFHGEAIDIVFVDEPSLYPLVKRMKIKKCIYRPTDVYSEMRNSLRVNKQEVEILALADGIICTSTPVKEY